MKTFIKFFKIFFSLICTVVVIGFILITIKNYTITEVQLTALKDNYYVKETFNFPGKITTKDSNVIEIRAERDMSISDIMVKRGQIMEYNDEKRLFTLKTEGSSSDDNEAISRYNEQIRDLREAINEEYESASEFLGKQVNSIDQLREDQEIVVYAPSNGKITGLTIGRDNKLNGDLIANIIDDSILTIPFYMTPYEYSNIKVGQEILVTYTGYEGYYKGKVISVNPNTIPGPDKISYVHTGVIEAENPGLISIGVGVGVHLSANGQATSTLFNSAKVESFADQGQVKSPIYSTADNQLNVIKLNVIEGQKVKKGDEIAVLGGPAIADRMKRDAKSIRAKLDQISKIQKELDKELQALYGDLVKSNVPNKFKVGEGGVCYTSDRIYIDYVADGSTVRKGDVLIRYRLCGEDNLVITATVDREIYEMLFSQEITRETSVTYYNKKGDKFYKAKALDYRKYDDRYEIIYELQNEGYFRYALNDDINLSVTSEFTLWNVVPKTAIIPIDGYKSGKYCYVYVLEQEETMYGTVDVIRQKNAYINYAGSNFVSITIMDNMVDPYTARIVDNMTTVLRDGMRVKAVK